MTDDKITSFEELHGGATYEDCDRQLKNGGCFKCPFGQCRINQDFSGRIKEILEATDPLAYLTLYAQGKVPKKREVLTEKQRNQREIREDKA